MSKERTAPASSEKLELDPKFIGKVAGTLLAICAVVALLLGVVNSMTEPIITQLQADKKTAAMSQVLTADEYRESSSDVSGVSAIYEGYTGGSLVGYVVEVTPNGFGGAISMTVGVSADDLTVTGVAVTDQSETSNVGTKVVGNQDVLDRFVGMGYGESGITVNSGSNRFDGVSGATVSSKGVTTGVNTALQAAKAAAGQ
jgi:electron transport complex protein RnfG